MIARRCICRLDRLREDGDDEASSLAAFVVERAKLSRNAKGHSLTDRKRLKERLRHDDARQICLTGKAFNVKGERKKRLSPLATEERTMIFYEAPHKLRKTLKDLAEVFGNDRRGCNDSDKTLF